MRPSTGDVSAVQSGSGFRRIAPYAVLTAFGLLAVLLGQTNSWDLRNYHLYDGWAFWTGRGDRDFAVAQMQTYFNPLLATFTYLLYFGLPPWLSTFALGALQGANFLPLHAIARKLLVPAGTKSRDWLPMAAALVGTLGATQISELGGSMGDNLVSLPTLCAFAIVLHGPELGPRRAAFAGLLLGLTTGVKLTVAPFAIGLVACVLALAWNQRDRWRILAATAGAAAIGFLVTDGFWMLHLYREFGNPMHPMYAGVFGGDYAPPMSMRDDRFVPHKALEWLFYPLVWLTEPHRVSDSWFFDLRIPLAFLAVPLLIRQRDAAEPRLQRALLLGLAAAYLVWLPLFGIYRYLAPLEMLAPLLVLLVLERDARTAATMLLLAMLVCVRPPGWGRLHTYRAAFLEAEIPALPELDRATIVLAEDEPLAFFALAFPPSARFVRIGGNLLGPPNAAYGMDREAARRIAQTDGRIYALLASPQSDHVREVLARQHLALDPPCAPLRANLLKRNSSAVLCPLQRRPES